MNLLESLLALITKEEKPLHVGEVMNLWKLMLALEEGYAILSALTNHTADAELKRYIESYLTDFQTPWMKRVADFMKERGIPLPPATTGKPNTDAPDIPLGAKFTDPEIATLLAAKVRAGTELTQQALLECMNYGLAQMLLELEAVSYRQAFVLRALLEKRGWLKLPPTWHAPGMPTT